MVEVIKYQQAIKLGVQNAIFIILLGHMQTPDFLMTKTMPRSL